MRVYSTYTYRNLFCALLFFCELRALTRRSGQSSYCSIRTPPPRANRHERRGCTLVHRCSQPARPPVLRRSSWEPHARGSTSAKRLSTVGLLFAVSTYPPVPSTQPGPRPSFCAFNLRSPPAIRTWSNKRIRPCPDSTCDLFSSSGLIPLMHYIPSNQHGETLDREEWSRKISSVQTQPVSRSGRFARPSAADYRAITGVLSSAHGIWYVWHEQTTSVDRVPS
ncbi:hypothetical protein OF83DRAFT_276271 [Amylostereum chailletii]|nr:hypothetical protein OF83DRAFT_276271 [Amylostereum chailletii]